MRKVPAFQSVVFGDDVIRCFGQTRKESPAGQCVYVTLFFEGSFGVLHTSCFCRRQSQELSRFSVFTQGSGTKV